MTLRGSSLKGTHYWLYPRTCSRDCSKEMKERHEARASGKKICQQREVQQSGTERKRGAERKTAVEKL